MWVLQVIIFSIIVGFFTVLRKKAIENTNIFFVLALSSSIGFLLIGWNFSQALEVDAKTILLILSKSILIAGSWCLELIALKKYYVSVLQPFSVIRVIVTFFASMIVFSEKVFWWQFIGIIIVFIGIFFLNKDTKKDINESFTKKKKIICILCFILSCILSSVSSIIDKYVMMGVNEFQMQIWYMLFISVILWSCFFIECIIKKKILITKSSWSNVYIYLIAVMLILADQLLFRALTDPASKASIVSVIRQISLVVSVIYGGIMYREPYLKERMVYLGIILFGIIIVLI